TCRSEEWRMRISRPAARFSWRTIAPFLPVISAKAGTHLSGAPAIARRIPPGAGMTDMSIPLEIDALGDRQTVEMAPQAIEPQFAPPRRPPVAAAEDARAA